ncbi:hypothetical protein [Salipiger aestuarii]|uniref:Uncharacterized protein n=1 Tax=Salipiger aestuarii TaxID=568098 RepID=A0A327YGS6_9RHOB|nr:hypothetical protein [Salipiger aestuarii]KAA8613150.1 hypothetical protein AL037_05330 [Salipiger aestuarii]KAB2542994.1 hypothetical protein AL035_03810 [Salipiger aestuarii]RAK19627.1 hypothetical protein ATI53_10089 [Salipiger aestuarii]
MTPDTPHNDLRPGFLALSTALTGFSEHELLGTGQTMIYLQTVCDMARSDCIADMLDAFCACAIGDDKAALDRHLRLCILSHPRHGPLARNLVKLWYTGTWHCLPRDWHESYGGNPADHDHIPSPTSYTEGLLWPAIGANPPGAKPFGYGMWANPPRVFRA